MARLQDFQTVTPSGSDKLLIVQSQGQGLAPHTIKMDSANPTGTGALSLNRASGSTVGTYSTTEGNQCTASATRSHAEGYQTTASGNQSHAENYSTTASGESSHAEGNATTASGSWSHAEGQGTIANHRAQHVFGRFNVEDPSTAISTAVGYYAEIVGKGSDNEHRSNARTLDWSGNEVLAGDLTIKGTKSLDTLTTTVTGTKTASSTDINVGNVVIKQYGNVVTVNGYAENVPVQAGTTVAFCTISGVSLPAADLRTTCGIARAAWAEPDEVGYIILETNGSLKVRSKTISASKYIYFSFSYIA